MPLLSFLSDEALFFAVNTVFEKAEEAKTKSDAEFGKNVIDPFSALFEIAGFDYDPVEWLKNEKTRQAQKTLSNSIGNFHQNLIGSLPDWKSHDKGSVIDVSNDTKRIVAEIKNKFNTTKGDSKCRIYDNLSNSVLNKNSSYKNYTGYYVEIIPQRAKRYNVVFTPSDNNTGAQRQTNELIRKIDGYSFYHLATGVPNALEQIYIALPKAIETIIPHIQISQQKRDFCMKYFMDAYEANRQSQ